MDFKTGISKNSNPRIHNCFEKFMFSGNVSEWEYIT